MDRCVQDCNLFFFSLSFFSFGDATGQQGIHNRHKGFPDSKQWMVDGGWRMADA